MPFKDPEARRAYNRSPERKAAQRERIRRFQQEHPEEWKAIHNRANAKYRGTHPDRDHASKKQWRDTHPEKCREYASSYVKRLCSTPEGRVEFNRRRNARPHAFAVQAVRLAIRAGFLPKPSVRFCLDCGKPAAQYHHQAGYDPTQWLTVVPLCRPCHYQRHGKVHRG